ncbi:AI-2E family transporter [Alicyclobacillus fastidiosus]|uniref:AI-2E family transporter n=1 Tax=Alicyclobacillus fastidiosus TaxID=392011 RepID=A0ABV5ADS3_9BACL|nr:AI-2E family transporter [Alicyclobacillus fastidiosus]WEH11305.1 AI-2E family transporter [Alicyclobacillus fastidiosus]
MWPTSRYFRATLSIFLTLLCIYLIGLLRGFFSDIWAVVSAVVYPFLASLIVSYVLQPLVDLLARRRVPRGAAILLIYFTFVLLVVVAVLNAVPVITKQVTQLVANMPGMVVQVNHWIDMVNAHKQYLPDTVRIGVENALNQVERNLTQSVSGVFSFISGAVNIAFIVALVPFLVFYMLKDGRSIGRGAVRLVPKSRREQVQELMVSVDHTLGSYIRGQFLVMLALGVLAFAGYLIVGMPYALLLAIFLAVADIIPYLGPFIGAAPAVFLAMTVSPAMVIKVLIVNVIVQQCEGNLISPQIMGRTLKLHPMAIVAALLIGGELGGLLGLIVAIPLLAVLKVVWTNIQEERHKSQI